MDGERANCSVVGGIPSCTDEARIGFGEGDRLRISCWPIEGGTDDGACPVGATVDWCVALCCIGAGIIEGACVVGTIVLDASKLSCCIDAGTKDGARVVGCIAGGTKDGAYVVGCIATGTKDGACVVGINICGAACPGGIWTNIEEVRCKPFDGTGVGCGCNTCCCCADVRTMDDERCIGIPTGICPACCDARMSESERGKAPCCGARTSESDRGKAPCARTIDGERWKLVPCGIVIVRIIESDRGNAPCLSTGVECGTVRIKGSPRVRLWYSSWPNNAGVCGTCGGCSAPRAIDAEPGGGPAMNGAAGIP